MEPELIAVFILLLTSMFFLYRKNKTIKKQKREITEKDKEIAGLSQEEKMRKEALRFPEGQKVISRSNEFDEPYEVGCVVKYEQVTRDSEKLPFIEVNKEVVVSFSVLVEHSDELENILKKLSNEEQYLLLSAKRS